MATSPALRTKLIYKKRQATAPYFDEPLFVGANLPMRMMVIPTGRFLMGSPQEELDRWSDEGPQHEVSVNAFCMGKYPITQAQWQWVAGLEQVEQELNPKPSSFEGDDLPVERVSWFDAVEFCRRLSRETKRIYRLPSEAEWEYTCRAGTTTPFHFGETITTELANYRGVDDEELKWSGSYGRGPKGEYREKTTAVDYFKTANAFGLCDMHGNVWEWCADYWHDSYEGAPTDGISWVSGDDSRRVIRGGSWLKNPRNCRSATRGFYLPRYTDNYVGLRVVCEGVPHPPAPSPIMGEGE